MFMIHERICIVILTRKVYTNINIHFQKYRITKNTITIVKKDIESSLLFFY